MIEPVHILIAHGSRDPEWRWPFEQIALELQVAHPGRFVVLCYLEMWSPSLAEAVFAAHAKGNRDFRITPLFWSRGRHLRDDLPKLVQDLIRELPDCSIVVEPPVGESEIIRSAVLRLLA